MGKRWERTAIVKIIRNRAIEGDYVVGEGKEQKPTGEVLTGYYPPILPADVIAQARDMLNRRRRGSGRNSGAINNLFGQKIRCGDCDGRMMLMGYKSRYLTCYEASRGSGCRNKTTYKYHHLEAAVLDSVLHLALDETFFRQAEKSNRIGLEIAECEKAIRDKQAYAKMLADMLRDRKSATIFETIMLTDSEVATLTTKLEALKVKHATAKGAATSEAHLRRIVGVREALADPDDAIRLPARLRVSEALQGVVDWIVCREFEGRGKVIWVALIGGQHSLWFDNDGKLVNIIEPDADSTPDDIITQFDPPEIRQRIHDYARRRKA
jgi:hypothetical protein